MIALTNNQPIYIACGATDMRKAINGLSLLVSLDFELDPLCEALFLFCNRKRDILKILHWQSDGFWLHIKRLEHGQFNWPSEHTGEKTLTLSLAELQHLLALPGLRQRFAQPEISAVFNG